MVKCQSLLFLWHLAANYLIQFIPLGIRCVVHWFQVIHLRVGDVDLVHQAHDMLSGVSFGVTAHCDEVCRVALEVALLFEFS